MDAYDLTKEGSARVVLVAGQENQALAGHAS
jgi:hypothetical protein